VEQRFPGAQKKLAGPDLLFACNFGVMFCLRGFHLFGGPLLLICVYGRCATGDAVAADHPVDVGGSGITIALVGARDARQAMGNAGAIGVQICGQEIALINEKPQALELA